ncbi:hypothetical protein DDZ13_03245 [Coraliomargarita sinensis]|uniref:Uncharacterized protein n=1 Tax=Coraliomargarita sinensis TaxID=2174842 RepID=A0A317ZHA3_9BACT|nr:hypothetical protein [Coraliomargarita sinensis]PXA04995.1 hypothetical protein DDZ13_03245 [Coraliomargarita sinensis]
MAEKATLLQEIPPVAKGSSSGNTTGSGAGGNAGVGTEVQTDSELSISAFQAVTYGSFVLTFILAGFAAVVLYRKAIGDIEQRIVRSAKVLAGVLAVLAMHGFVATYLYTNYLRNESDAAPISFTVLIWVILGATTAYVSNRLIELKDKVKTSDAVIDGIFYAIIFISVTLSVSTVIGPNAALIISLVAITLCVVPFSRFFTACKRIKFNRRGSKRKPGRSVLYTLVSLPSLVPLFAIVYVFEGIGPDVTLFLCNAVSLALVCYISFAMLTRINNAVDSETEGSVETAAAAPSTTSSKQPAAAPEMDPLVAELLAEQEASNEEPEPSPAPQAEAPDVVPPAKPARPNANPEQAQRKAPPPPAKPQARKEAPKTDSNDKKDDEQPQPGTNLKVKPPSKPKKRF